MTPAPEWRLRAATAADRAGATALAAMALPHDVAPGPFRAVDAEDLLASCWEPVEPDGSTARTVVRLVSEDGAGVLPGVDGTAVRVPAGLVLASLGPPPDGGDHGADHGADDGHGDGTGAGPGDGGRVAAGASGPAASVGYLHLLAVHPDRRRRGLGRALLDAAVAELAALGATSVTTAGRPPRFGWPGPDIRYTTFGLLAESAGFTSDHLSHNMTVDLDAASRDGLLDTAADVQRLAAGGVEVRRATAADLPAITAAAAEFGGTWPQEADISLGRDPVAVHLALRDGRVVGFACHATSRHGWFGPIGVSATERLGGVGAVLLRRCLVDVRAEGRAQAQVCWVGPVRFYARAVGGYVDRTFASHTRTL